MSRCTTPQVPRVHKASGVDGGKKGGGLSRTATSSWNQFESSGCIMHSPNRKKEEVEEKGLEKKEGQWEKEANECW